MKEIETDYIENLVNIMKNNELTEITLEDEKNSLVIKSSGYKPVIKEKITKEETEVEEKIVEQPVIEEKNKKSVPIISNMVGLFFSRPSPNEKPFVQAGDKIKAGQVICIIETIKLMNKITSEVSGKVAEICIEDGKPVEYGQVIMYIEQD